MRGKVKSLKPSYGFLKMTDGSDVFFLPKSVQGAKFEELTVDREVDAELEDSPKGLRASVVRAL